MAKLRTLAFAFLFSAVLVSGGCRKDEAPVQARAKGPETWFTMHIGPVATKVQVMVRPLELQEGLMHRATLGDDEGMVFVYPDPGARSFWMRNTLIPLDIGFFTPEGVLSEVHQMNPLDETPVPSYSENIQFAIEMNQDWYHKHDVKPGAKLDMKELRDAMVARGFEPKAFGMR